MSSDQRARAILANEVTVLVCTPTYSLHLAEVAEQEGINIRDSDVRLTIHAGEPGASLPATRHRIETAWGAKCFDHAGATEVGAWGYECAARNGLHVNEGEFICEVLDPDRGYEESAVANVNWALGHQRKNGWLDDCCLSDPTRPLTHTLGYALRGFLEAYRSTRSDRILNAARRTADGLLGVVGQDGYLPGMLFSDWTPAAKWVCLTGSVQIAHSWLLLYEHTKDVRYRDAGYAANSFVRRTVKLDGAADIRGGIQGSFPISGGYGKYRFLNWAAKFFIDSNLLEKSLRELES